MPRGGKRPGAGRPKGSKDPHTLERQRIEAAIRERVAAAIAPMTDAQVAAAKGVMYLVARKKRGGKFEHLTEELYKAILAGEDTEHEMIEVWAEKPNVQAFEELLDRSLGKPPQPVAMEHSGDITVRWQGE